MQLKRRADQLSDEDARKALAEPGTTPWEDVKTSLGL
jgi:hypothetical protein